MAYLEVHDIKKVCPIGEEALKGVDFEMSAQEVVALLGLSGSGKSTLLRCINRLVEPTSGTVSLDGIEVTAIRHRRQLRAMRQRRRRPPTLRCTEVADISPPSKRCEGITTRLTALDPGGGGPTSSSSLASSSAASVLL